MYNNKLTCFIFSQSHEVNLNITDAGCVITWDFDIIREAVTFSVLRVAKQGNHMSQGNCVPCFHSNFEILLDMCVIK